jgi:phage terminase small subunit
MEAKTLYKDYDKKVQDYMQNVIDCLKQDYKEIPTSWRISLDLIADNYAIYIKAKDAVLKEGLIRKDAHGRTFKNQSFPLMMNTQQILIKLLSSFALTPMSKSKMKSIDTDDFGIDDLLK